MKVPITKPYFGEEERRAVQEPLESGWVVQGPKVAEFEERFAAFADAGHAVACTSCTAALHLALAALELEEGDEVLVPAFTWISTAHAVEYVGAEPVFVDVDLETFNLDPDALQEAITPRTRAILPVHLFGLAAPMGPVTALAESRDLHVVEDAACAMGTRYRGRHVGTIGDLGCFSFHPRKAVTSGEGGAVLSERAELAEICRSLRDHGADRSDLDRHEERAGYLLPRYRRRGFNYRMTDLQGAVAVVQMDRAETILALRRERARRYDHLLDEIAWLRTPSVPGYSNHTYQSYVCLFRPEEPTLENVERLHERRNRIMDALEADGVATRPGTHAAAHTEYYRSRYDVRPEDHPRAYLAEKLSLTLPLYPQMTNEEQDYVVDRLRALSVSASSFAPS